MEMPDLVTDLTAPYGPLAYFLDLHPDLGDFRADVITGLSAKQKTLSPKYFYNEHGSKLFQKITTLKQYYPTLTEKELFLANADSIIEAIGPGAAIFEYGSGASEKIEWLLNGLNNPVAYVAMDISKDHLIESASAIANNSTLPVAAVCADFHAPVTLPENILPTEKHWLGFFPGSTIGNMAPEAAATFLKRSSETLGAGAKFLLGVDLEKDPDVLNAAYNDREGVTAAFNLNLLERMKNELGADLNIDDFEHHAFYCEKGRRIEMHLRAKRATEIMVNEQTFSFEEGETLHTENSHKYSVPRLEKLFAQTPWRLEKMWTDPKGWFAACLLSNT
ncbi:MAG: dimethylhistidine N-methyltransferase [Hyphococcus sp.]|nr:MAG: dimethylhistidine N-methyltransferase [Marinicaulis sp.]